MQEIERVISKAFGSITIPPRGQRVCTLIPPDSPYFEPRRCRIACLNMNDPSAEMDLKIGSVCVGGSPQLAINELNPDERSAGLRPEDLDYVNWSVFSTVGLAREIQFTLYNPNEAPVAVFVCLDGLDVNGLDVYPNENWEEHAARRSKRFMDAMLAADDAQSEIGWQKISGSEVELEPLEQRIIRVVPTVSSYFDPNRFKFHGHRVDDGKRIPFTVVDVFCGKQILYGSMVDELFDLRSNRHQHRPQETPQQLLRRLEEMVNTLTRYGRSGLEMLEDRSAAPTYHDARGMLTTHLVEKSGWGDASWWPIISTNGFRRELGVVVHNPWPFRIRASVSLQGQALMSPKECEAARQPFEEGESECSDDDDPADPMGLY